MSALLVAIRGDRSQGEAGAAAGRFLPDGQALSQAKVSRAEAGTFPLSPDEAEALARGCGATPEDRRRLVELARAHQARHSPSRPAVVRNARTAERRILKLEAESALVRSWQDSVVIGTVQTSAWTEAARKKPTPAWWKAREGRLALLDEQHRQWHLLMSEAALRWNLGAEVMAAQLDHLVEVSRRPNVQLGVVPLGPERVGAPPRPFHLYDRRMAQVATDQGPVFLDDPGDVAHYETQFAQVDALALYGDRLRELLQRLASEYRSLNR